MTITQGDSSASGNLDGELFISLSNNDTDVILKTDWTEKIIAKEKDYLSSEKARMLGDIGTFQHVLNQVVEVLNHTKGKNKVKFYF